MKENNCSIGKCSRRCDICKSFLVVSTEFICHATKRKYKTRGILTCNTKNTIYMISCKCCSRQYIGIVPGFKERFWFDKSGNNTHEIRCWVASHLSNVCKSAICKIEYLQIQLIEQIVARESEDIDKILWKREKYWQVQVLL